MVLGVNVRRAGETNRRLQNDRVEDDEKDDIAVELTNDKVDPRNLICNKGAC